MLFSFNWFDMASIQWWYLPRVNTALMIHALKLRDDIEWSCLKSVSQSVSQFIALQKELNPTSPIKATWASLSTACLHNRLQIKVYEKCRTSTDLQKRKSWQSRNKKWEEKRWTTDFISLKHTLFDSLFHKKQAQRPYGWISRSTAFICPPIRCVCLLPTIQQKMNSSAPTCEHKVLQNRRGLDLSRLQRFLWHPQSMRHIFLGLCSTPCINVNLSFAYKPTNAHLWSCSAICFCPLFFTHLHVSVTPVTIFKVSYSRNTRNATEIE